jgi:four helix bundle protein
MSFEKLRVYQAAELLDRIVNGLIPDVKEGYAGDVAQLRRAAASVPYNIAEAFGSVHKGQKIYHLGIARGSVDETRSVLRKLAKAGALKPTLILRPVALAVTIAKMLTAWIETLDDAA